MYYPILRGRQNELLAIKELLQASKLSKRIVPIIEPVKLSPTLVNTLEAFAEMNRDLIVIQNPKVGSFSVDARNGKNTRYLRRFEEILNGNKVLPGVIVDSNISQIVEDLYQRGIADSEIVSICNSPDTIKFHEEAFSNCRGIRTVVPYAPAFRRIRKNRILLEDKFNKRGRNQEYSKESDEFFSDDHIYFEEEGYVGFSDYSIIGADYSESGFAPYAVAIHIIYANEANELRVRHFVSIDNDDISDPARKFYQAVQQLVEWNKTQKLDTLAIQMFEKIYEEQSYPGLGVVKKLSLMHHLELIGRFLDGELK